MKIGFFCLEKDSFFPSFFCLENFHFNDNGNWLNVGIRPAHVTDNFTDNGKGHFIVTISPLSIGCLFSGILTFSALKSAL